MLLQQPGVALHYQLAVYGDELTVHCEAAADAGALADQVRAALRDRLGVTAQVAVGRPGSVPRGPGKAVRVVAA